MSRATTSQVLFFASACVALAACGKDELPGLTTRDAGRDSSINDATVDATSDAQASDSSVDAGDTGVDAVPRNLVDFTVSAEGFIDLEANTVFARLEDRSRGTFSDVYSGIIASGAFTISMPLSFDRDLFGMPLYVYIDANGNTVCDAEVDTLTQIFISNDFATGAASIYFEQGSAELMMGTCDVF